MESKFKKGDVVRVNINSITCIGVVFEPGRIFYVDVMTIDERVNYRVLVTQDKIEKINNLNVFEMLKEKGVL